MNEKKASLPHKPNENQYNSKPEFNNNPQVPKYEVKKFMNIQNEETNILPVHKLFFDASNNHHSPDHILKKKIQLDSITIMNIDIFAANLKENEEGIILKRSIPTEQEETLFTILINLLIKQIKENGNNNEYLYTSYYQIMKETEKYNKTMDYTQIKESLFILNRTSYNISITELEYKLMEGNFSLLYDFYYDEKKDKLIINFSNPIKKMISNRNYTTNYYALFCSTTTRIRKLLTYLMENFKQAQKQYDGTTRCYHSVHRDILGEVIQVSLRNRKPMIDVVLKKLQKKNTYIKNNKKKEKILDFFEYDKPTKIYKLYPSEHLVNIIKKNNYYNMEQQERKNPMKFPIEHTEFFKQYVEKNTKSTLF